MRLQHTALRVAPLGDYKKSLAELLHQEIKIQFRIDWIPVQ